MRYDPDPAGICVHQPRLEFYVEAEGKRCLVEVKGVALEESK